MVELTHGGFWWKWSSVTRRDRYLSLFSIVAFVLAAVPIALEAYLIPLIGRDGFAYVILAAVLLIILSFISISEVNRNQDEMFKQMQNFANAQAGNSLLAIIFIWWTLSLGGWIGAPPLTILIVLGGALWLMFWFYAVRRWA